MRTSEVLALREKVFHRVRQYIWDHSPKCITARINSKQILKKCKCPMFHLLGIHDWNILNMTSLSWSFCLYALSV